MTPDPEYAPRDEREPLSATVGFHVRSIMAAAERAGAAARSQAEQRAAEVLREADDEARRRLERARREADDLVAARRRRLAELSDAVARRAEAVLADLDSAGQARRALDEVLRSLTAAAGSLPEGGSREWPLEQVAPGTVPDSTAEASSSDSAVKGSPTDSTAEASSREPASPDSGPRPGEGPAQGLTGPRLVAYQMAQAGSTRAEVAAHVQRTFGLHDVHDVLNDVFPDSTAS